MKTLTIAAAAIALSAVSAVAQVSLGQSGLFSPRLSVASVEVPEVSAPARASVFAEKSFVAVDPDMDAAKAARLQELALKKIHITEGGGGCYGAVWHDVLVKAGFDDGGLIPGTHAYQFAKHAKENPEWFLNVFKMKLIPTPDSIDEMPAGSVVVYDRGQRDPYGRASGDSGHIEVIADRDGVRYGCSDFCADIGGMGPMFADDYSKEHVSVFIPVK